MMNKENKSKEKYNILFIATDHNYFVNDNASFSRMYNNLLYFHNHKEFNVIVLQSSRDRAREERNLKNGIITYYFKELVVFNYNLFLFTDFNPFYLYKILKIIKKHKIDLFHIEYEYGLNILRLIRKTPISYNAYNVESIYMNQVGQYYKTIPRVFRSLFSKYIFFLEKYALKLVNNINAVSYIDKKKIIEMYNVPKEKIIVSTFGYRTEIFNNTRNQKEARERLKIKGDKFVVIFHTSYFSNDANKEATDIIRELIAPKVKDKDILLLLAGKMPSFQDRENLRFLGFVEDLNDFIYSADIAIAPILRGSGIKTKIIDYLSGGIPVITTKKGAEGILMQNGVHGFIITGKIKNFIEKINFLKNHPKEIKEMKLNIRDLYYKYYNWDLILKKVAARYKFIIESLKNY